MKIRQCFKRAIYFSSLLAITTAQATTSLPTEHEPPIPRFSIANMDTSVSPSVDFYSYANGNWQKKNPVPADRSRWSSFSELDERNIYLLHGLLEDARNDQQETPRSPKRLVGDFFASAMDTNRLEQLRATPIQPALTAVERINNLDTLFITLANFHRTGVNALFDIDAQPDEKNSTVYALQIWQGGLTLPDRDYYLKDDFKTQRTAYQEHIKRMFELLGEQQQVATQHADVVLSIETELAKVSRSRVDLRDPLKNYNKFTKAELIIKNPLIPWNTYLSQVGINDLQYAIVGQPEYFVALENLLKIHSLDDWKIYLRWHILHGAAPYLSHDFESENFNFFGKILKGQQQQKVRWKRANDVIDAMIGEALGQLYVEKYFPPEAKARMNDLVNNLRAVFRDHLQKLDWMSQVTKEKALAKFHRFTQKIGYPDHFRDYSSVVIKRDDYFGNIERASRFEIQRRINRIGKMVDKNEWEMTPPTVNAYFNPPLNEIVFPAGILQPPYFDTTMDDPVNYGAIAMVIGHEITHGYDDEGRHYDADGNLNEWWTAKDAQAFNERAQKIVAEYDSFEVLPGIHVNGKLTLGENIADLGGVSIAYDAMQRALQQDPTKRTVIDGLTPEQRFFISYAQIWHTAIKDEEAKRLNTVDTHAPGRFRAFGPLLNYETFYDAFGIKPGSPMWRAPALRAKIW